MKAGQHVALPISSVAPNRIVVIPASLIISGLEAELTESLTMARRIVITDAIDYIKQHSGRE